MQLSAESLRTEGPAEVLSRLASGLHEATHRGVRAMVLKLSGESGKPRAGEAAGGGPSGTDEAAERVSRALDGYRRRGGTVTACSEGRIAGLLMELALAADLHLAAEGARFVLPGLFDDHVPCLGAWTRLVGRVGSGRARALLLCPGEKGEAGLDASAAQATGLCDAVVASDRLAPAAREITETLERCSPAGAEMARRLGGRKRSFGFLTARQERLLESATFSLCFASDHPREGIAAFFEGRRPQFNSTKDER